MDIKNKVLQYKQVKMIFDVISALILLPTLKSGDAFYITLFILVIDRVMDAFFDTEDSVYIFYSVWHLINKWLGVASCTLAFSMVYPGFSDIVARRIELRDFNTFLLISVFSMLVCEIIEIIHMDIRSKKIVERIINQKEGK